MNNRNDENKLNEDEKKLFKLMCLHKLYPVSMKNLFSPEGEKWLKERLSDDPEHYEKLRTLFSGDNRNWLNEYEMALAGTTNKDIKPVTSVDEKDKLYDVLDKIDHLTPAQIEQIKKELDKFRETKLGTFLATNSFAQNYLLQNERRISLTAVGMTMSKSREQSATTKTVPKIETPKTVTPKNEYDSLTKATPPPLKKGDSKSPYKTVPELKAQEAEAKLQDHPYDTAPEFQAKVAQSKTFDEISVEFVRQLQSLQTNYPAKNGVKNQISKAEKEEKCLSVRGINELSTHVNNLQKNSEITAKDFEKCKNTMGQVENRINEIEKHEKSLTSLIQQMEILSKIHIELLQANGGKKPQLEDVLSIAAKHGVRLDKKQIHYPPNMKTLNEDLLKAKASLEKLGESKNKLKNLDLHLSIIQQKIQETPIESQESHKKPPSLMRK